MIRTGAAPLPDTSVDAIIADFLRDGYRLIPGVLGRDEVAAA